MSNIICNTGFVIGLFSLTAILPYNIVNCLKHPQNIPVTIALVGLAIFLWCLSIRSLKKYKTFVYFKEDEERTPILVNGVDIEAVEEAMAEEQNNV